MLLREVEKLVSTEGGVPQLLAQAFSRATRAVAAAEGWADKRDAVRRLLAVLLASREPLPLHLVSALGLSDAVPHLPLWGSLFYAEAGRLHVLHGAATRWLGDKGAEPTPMPHIGPGSGLACEKKRLDGPTLLVDDVRTWHIWAHTANSSPLMQL